MRPEIPHPNHAPQTNGSKNLYLHTLTPACPGVDNTIRCLMLWQVVFLERPALNWAGRRAAQGGWQLPSSRRLV